MRENTTRRQARAAMHVAQARLDDALTLLAAAVLQYGHDGRLDVSGESVQDVAELSDTRSVKVQTLTNGRFRIDFSAPDVIEMRVLEEVPAC